MTKCRVNTKNLTDAFVGQIFCFLKIIINYFGKCG